MEMQIACETSVKQLTTPKFLINQFCAVICDELLVVSC